MRVKILSAVIAGLLVAGCGGGGDDDNPAAAASPGGSTGVAGAGTGSAAAADATPVSSAGTQYLNQAAQAAQTQAQQSETVVQKSTNPEVRILAQNLKNEVNFITQNINQVSQTNNVTINNNVTNQQQTQINTINNLSGAELDRAFVTGLVDTWKSLLAATLAQARQGTDVQVRQTASANILVIEQRLVIAEELLLILQPTGYLADVYEDGLLEIRLGQLALQNATNAQVRQFAQRMIDDHTQINSRVSALAQQKSVTLPSALSAAHQEIVALVSSFSGAAFDKAYMDRNALIHAEDVSKTTVVSQRGTDTEINALATQSLPLLQEHLQQAQGIATSLQAAQLYQLGQGVTTELQIAQLAQARSTNDRIRNLARQIIAENQAGYAQLTQLAQQRNASIPLAIPPGRIQALRQLLRLTGTDLDRVLLTLISEQTGDSLQTVQSMRTGDDAGINSFVEARAAVLQARMAQLTSDAGGAASGDAGATGAASTDPDTADAATPGTPAADTTTGTTTDTATGTTTDTATGTATDTATGTTTDTATGTTTDTATGTTSDTTTGTTSDTTTGTTSDTTTGTTSDTTTDTATTPVTPAAGTTMPTGGGAG